MNISQYFDYIATFSEIDNSRRQILKDNSALVEVKSGRSLLPVGSVAKEVFFVLKGVLKIRYMAPDGKEAIIGLIHPGGHIGLVALVSSLPRTTEVVALTQATLIKIEGDSFINVLQSEPKLCYTLLSSVAARLEQTSRHFIQQSLLSLPNRIFTRLLEMAEIVEIDGQESLVVRDIPTHQHLASLVGASREAVSRAMKTLAEDRNIENIDELLLIRSTPSF